MKKKNRYNFRTIYIAVLTSIVFLISTGCKKTTNTTAAGNVSGSYELVLHGIDGTSLTNFYNVTIVDNNGAITGDIQLLLSNGMNQGVVTGSVTGSAFKFKANMPGGDYDFTFASTITAGGKQSIISGTVTPASGTLAPFDANMILVGNYSAPLNSTVNPCIFKKVLTAVNPSGAPVIFVHGMMGSLQSWDTIVMNLSAEFKARHDIYEFQYNWQDFILNNGASLKDSVDANGLKLPILIAHSMGGLVSRAYVVSGGKISMLVTLGTPHEGTPLVKQISLFKDLDYDGPRDMLPTSDFIKNIGVDPLDIAARGFYYLIAGQMNGSFTTKNLVQTWTWDKPWYDPTDISGYKAFHSLYDDMDNDGLVPVTSAEFEMSNTVNHPLDLQQCDHFNLIKPVRAPVEIMNYINGL